MSEGPRILVSEDQATDFELERREIRRLLPEAVFQRVETRQAFLEALERFQPELVISDYRMPAFDGLTALRLTLEHAPGVPVVMVTGAINEDTAVECMKAGAADYVIKEHMKRLGPAVVRALEEKQERQRRREAEVALNESNERLRQLAESIDSVLFVLDLEDTGPRVSYLSPACERVFGVSREAVVRAPFAWMDNVRAEDRPAVEKGVSAMFSGQTGEVEIRYRAVSPPRHIRLKAQTVKDENRLPVRVVGLVEDVTAETEAAEARTRLEGQLAQAQKMETVGRLAGGVAHDFNNMICVILGYAQLAQTRLQAPDRVRQDLGEIEKAAERARDITAQLLAFSRKQLTSPRVLELNEHVRATCKALARLIREDIELRFDPSPEPCHVRFDASQLDQVLVNLGVNARDAMPRGGTLELSLRCLDDVAELRVRDTGVGMAPELIEHIFEPFFTTKETGKGTGLGLATVYGIVQQNGGRIEVQSKPGEGSTFVVRMPRARVEDGAAGARTKAGAETGTGRILLVEDDAQVRHMTAEILRELGYTVLEAHSASEALELGLGRDFELVVSDVVMPGLNGPELCARLREAKPELAVLFISGYAPEPHPGHEATLEGVRLLQKPFDRASLAREVRAALERQ